MRLINKSRVRVLMDLALIVIFSIRVWPRYTSPSVWNEDGAQNIPKFIALGWSSVFETVNGYIILVPKIITALSLSISFSYYPEISTFFTVLFTLFVFDSIITARISHSKTLPFLFALACILVPSDPEVFGLPLYTFWWSALLLFITLLWDDDKDSFYKRILYTVIGMLSTPIGVILLPVFWIRFIYRKYSRNDLIIGVVASICALIQMRGMLTSLKVGTMDLEANLASPLLFIPRVIGAYFYGNYVAERSVSLLWCLGIIYFIYLIFLIRKSYRSYSFNLLVLILAISILILFPRIDFSHADPRLVAQRYFFYPFILISWIFLYVLCGYYSNRIKLISAIGLILGVVNFFPVTTRFHDSLEWRKHVSSCQFFENYAIPFHMNGESSRVDYFAIDKAACFRLRDGDLLLNSGINPNQVHYFTVNTIYPLLINQAEDTVFESSFAKKFNNEFKDVATQSSFIVSDSDVGSLKFKARKGTKIFYRSGPRTAGQRLEIRDHRGLILVDRLPSSRRWVTLEFSSDLLPNIFEIKVIDQGDGWGEWNEVGFCSQLSECMVLVEPL